MPIKPKDLPRSDDKEFWGEDAESYISKIEPIPICKTHAKGKWMEHVGYIDNKDGTASCKHCNWGFRIPGYLRIHKYRVYDLRKG